MVIIPAARAGRPDFRSKKFRTAGETNVFQISAWSRMRASVDARTAMDPLCLAAVAIKVIDCRGTFFALPLSPVWPL